MGKDIGGSMIRTVNKKEARSMVKGVEWSSLPPQEGAKEGSGGKLTR